MIVPRHEATDFSIAVPNENGFRGSLFDLEIEVNRARLFFAVSVTFVLSVSVFFSLSLSLSLSVCLSVSLLFGSGFFWFDRVDRERKWGTVRGILVVNWKHDTHSPRGETKGTRGSNWKWYLVTTSRQPRPNNLPFSTMLPLSVRARTGCPETSVTLIKQRGNSSIFFFDICCRDFLVYLCTNLLLRYFQFA